MKDQYLDLVCIKNAIPEFILKVYSILEVPIEAILEKRIRGYN